jgi:hypothetical protein
MGLYTPGEMMVSTTPINIIPTLDTQSILTDPRDILAYVLRYYCTAPKSVSNSTYGQMISFADTASKYQSNVSNMVSHVTSDLKSVLQRFFKGNVLTVDIGADDNGNNTYDIVIQLAVTVNNVNYSLGANVSVGSTGILNVTWHPQLN